MENEETNESPLKERMVKRLFSQEYDYPGNFKHVIHAIYDPNNDAYMIIQNTFCKDESQLKELTAGLDILHQGDSEKYRQMQEDGYLDEDGNYTGKIEADEQKKKGSSLTDKVKNMKK